MRSINQSRAPDGEAILVADAGGVVIWAGAEAGALLGASPREVIGRRLHDLLTPWTEPAGAPTAPQWAESASFTQFKTAGGVPIEARSEQAAAEASGPIGSVWRLRLAAERASHGASSECDSVSRSFLEDGADGTFRLSRDGRFIAVSGGFSELCGHPAPQSLLDSLCAAGAAPFYVEPNRHGELMQQLQETRSVTRFESAIYRRDGTTTWISQNVRAVVDASGEVREYAGTVLDIGWRKLAEDILNQAEEKWRAVVESSGECIVIADRDGLVLFGNQRAQQSGIGLAGANVFSGFSPASQQHLRSAIDGVFRTVQPEVITIERTDGSADRAWYEVRVVPIGSVELSGRVILIATDLTAKKRAEEAVRESQRMMGRVADASPAILYVYDFASERCIYVNHQVKKILGYTREDAMKVVDWIEERLVHHEDGAILAQRRRMLSESTQEGAVFEYTFRFRHARGEWRWMRARDVVFTRSEDGRPAQILGMAEDITERRRAGQERERSREQLRALSARLQEAREEERAAISRRVHDELGQALTALSWELTKLTDHFPLADPAQPSIARRLGDMGSMVDGMMQIVRKVAAELRPPILDHFGLVAALEWQAQEFEERYRVPCEVAARLRGETPDRTVSTAIFRIFQEILTNVARHAAATRVRVEFNDSPHGFSLIVHDNGRGITEGEEARSLGILGMRERAHLFGGSIDIRGARGRGTTVTVQVPASRRESGEGPRKESLRTPP